MGRSAMSGVLKTMGSLLSREGMSANMAAYHAKYIKSGSFAPVFHVMGGAFCIGYSLEHSHLKHAEHERQRTYWTEELKKGHGHHWSNHSPRMEGLLGLW